MQIKHDAKAFDQLSNDELYALLQLRSAVFVVEQTCVYQDIDGLDKQSQHFLAWDMQAATDKPALAAYLRIIPPGVLYVPVSMGRVVTDKAYRSKRIASELILFALDWVQQHYSRSNIQISAQAHLSDFYQGFGFFSISDIYLEDNIPHIAMQRSY